MLTVLPLFFWVRSHADTFGAETAQKLRPRQLAHFQFRPTDDLRREVVNLAIVRTTLNRQLNNFKVSTGLTYLNGFHGEGSFRAGRTNGWRTAEVLMDERIARGMQNSHCHYLWLVRIPFRKEKVFFSLSGNVTVVWINSVPLNWY